MEAFPSDLQQAPHASVFVYGQVRFPVVPFSSNLLFTIT
jgi:hypothetical protein